MTLREKSILIGLYLSKYDTAGLSALGFSTFKEAYNTLGLAIGAKATSLKNYRDELDPYFPNSRKGWHKRELRDHCKQIYDRHKDTDLDFLRHLICKLCGDDFRQITPFHEPHTAEGSESFAKRIMTGRAAENYFTKNYRKVPAFS
ncbi:MAG: hypothetical protein K9M45_13190, partial [Kiritimatiellales bacterium]|nr:hypothetical protein [Kiritimatiellales bacterium]